MGKRARHRNRGARSSPAGQSIATARRPSTPPRLRGSIAPFGGRRASASGSRSNCSSRAQRQRARPRVGGTLDHGERQQGRRLHLPRSRRVRRRRLRARSRRYLEELRATRRGPGLAGPHPRRPRTRGARAAPAEGAEIPEPVWRRCATCERVAGRSSSRDASTGILRSRRRRCSAAARSPRSRPRRRPRPRRLVCTDRTSPRSRRSPPHSTRSPRPRELRRCSTGSSPTCRSRRSSAPSRPRPDSGRRRRRARRRQQPRRGEDDGAAAAPSRPARAVLRRGRRARPGRPRSSRSRRRPAPARRSRRSPSSPTRTAAQGRRVERASDSAAPRSAIPN